LPRPRDILTAGPPAILFVGINPGATSGTVGHHFAGPGNTFWKLLFTAGLTPRELAAAEDQELATFGHALINLCTRPTKTASELTRAELARGRTRLLAAIRVQKPRVVALVGVTLYPIVVGRAAAKATPGAGPKPERLEGARLFVVPNPSGLNATFPTFAAKLPWFEALRAFAAARSYAPRNSR
jgi:TDG/mug DNA glycosylase family protein